MEPPLKIHPAAACFPMLREDELHDLAESIKAEGLAMPIVLATDGVLLDGRNRLAACELVGVEPRFTTYSGADQTAYVIAANVRRRNLSEGQRAVIHAMALSPSGHSLRTHAKLHDISRTRLSLANTVLKNAPDLAEQVRLGVLGLDAANDLIRRRKAEAETIQAQHDHLLRHAPDLAAQVTEGHLTRDAATAALDKRLEDERLRRRVEEIDAIRRADRDPGPALAGLADHGDIDWQQAHQRAEDYLTQRQAAINRDQQHLTTLADSWTALRNLARCPDSAYATDVLDGLTPEARALTDHLIALEAQPKEAHQHS
ncbi:ParB N-terminal domain-containing protein [Kitasatospora aureofaciens]|uniref:ParB N-terminal domain-containing protein n=1 Tax=Kitasatospora aureofaciens TaxID=1894 RepID=UPI00340FDD0F